MKANTVYVDNADALVETCNALRGCDRLAVDTEFIRERTYFPKTCLVQLAADGHVWLVDPLTAGPLDPLYELLNDLSITKLLHAARQDYEIFYHDGGVLPAPVFDTQVAAALAGYPDQVGYATLVADIVGVELPKTQTRTDWSKRPLTDAQRDYAADDVRYLRAVHDALVERLSRDGRLAWAREDSEVLCDASLYAIDPQSAFKRIKAIRRMSGKPRRVLQALAAWREQEAAARNLPRRWLVADDVLVAIAKGLPDDRRSLAAIEGVKDRFAKRYADTIVALLDEALATQDSPAVEKTGPPDAEERALVRRLQQRVEQIAERLGVPAATLAPRRELARAARGQRDLPVHRGWRRDVIGREIDAIVAEVSPDRR